MGVVSTGEAATSATRPARATARSFIEAYLELPVSKLYVL
jgi:hypothetical protein